MIHPARCRIAGSSLRAVAALALCWLAACDGALGPDAPGQTFAAVAPGGGHTCGLAPTGEVYCWGRGDTGELGRGTDRSSMPKPVLLRNDYVAVTTGRQHTCALRSGGDVDCWGWNHFGQLGNGSTIDIPEPLTVPAPAGFLQVDAGRFHTCGILSTGGTMCWGENGQGQLGDGSRTMRLSATAIADTTRFVKVSAGGEHTCALTAANEAWCWGLNNAGQLGTGTTSSTDRPVPVQTSVRFSDIAAGGAHTCAVAVGDGRIYCWGANAYGQLGNTAVEPDGIPTTVVGPVFGNTRFEAVTTGDAFSCGRSRSVVYCWGRGLEGQLGNGSRFNLRTPRPVYDQLRLASVEAGDSHACGTTSGGVVYCWGAGPYGALGNPETISAPLPVRVEVPVAN